MHSLNMFCGERYGAADRHPGWDGTGRCSEMMLMLRCRPIKGTAIKTATRMMLGVPGTRYDIWARILRASACHDSPRKAGRTWVEGGRSANTTPRLHAATRLPVTAHLDGLCVLVQLAYEVVQASAGL